MRCPSCALNNFDDVVACRRCGTPFSTTNSPRAASPSRAPSRAPSTTPGAPHTGELELDLSVSPSMRPRAAASVMPPRERFAPSTSAFVDGDIVEMPLNGGSLPAVCCKCGTSRDLVPRSAKLSYTSPGIYVLAFCLAPFGLLFMLLALSLGSKKASIDFPVCPRCDARWRNANIIWTFAVLSPFVLGLLAGMTAPRGGGTNLLTGLGVFLGTFLVLPVLVRLLVVKPATIVADRIDEVRVRLSGFSPEARATIERVAGPRGAVWDAGSGNMGIIVALVGVMGLGLFAVLAIYGVRKYVANARASRDGTAEAAESRPSEEHVAEIEAAYSACLANADARAEREESQARGDLRALDRIADRRRVARFACSDLKRDCMRGYYSIPCQAALPATKGR